MNKELVKAIQKKVGATPDGIIGDKTLAALAKALEVSLPEPTTMPTQAQVRAGTSIFGRAGCEDELVNIVPPYTLYYEGKAVKTIRVHRLIAERVEAALKAVLEHYGQDAISRLGLDVYSGSYNYRSTSTGSSLSMHAWGIALDFDAEHNSYAMKKPKARFSGAEYDAWWRIWEEQGAVSLGRERDVDWMHLQFARL